MIKLFQKFAPGGIERVKVLSDGIKNAAEFRLSPIGNGKAVFRACEEQKKRTSLIFVDSTYTENRHGEGISILVLMEDALKEKNLAWHQIPNPNGVLSKSFFCNRMRSHDNRTY